MRECGKDFIDDTLTLLEAAGLSETAAWTGYLTLRSYTLGFTVLKITRASVRQPHLLEFANGLDVLIRGLRAKG